MKQENYNRKFCIYCAKEIRGRSDKKYCGDICRNQHHNNQKASANNLMRNINHVLGRNRSILNELCNHDTEKETISISLLMSKGFRFSFFTHVKPNEKGSNNYYCYDLGYTLVNDDYCQIVKDPAL